MFMHDCCASKNFHVFLRSGADVRYLQCNVELKIKK